MNNYNEAFSDSRLRGLLNNLLVYPEAGSTGQLLNTEAGIVMGCEPMVMPNPVKEKEFCKLLRPARAFDNITNALTSIVAVAAVCIALLLKGYHTPRVWPEKQTAVNRFNHADIAWRTLPAEQRQKPANEAGSKLKRMTPYPSVDQFPPPPAMEYTADTSHQYEFPFAMPPVPALNKICNDVYNEEIQKKLSDPLNRFSIDTAFAGVKRLVVKGMLCKVNIAAVNDNKVSLQGALKLETKGIVRTGNYKLRVVQQAGELTVWVEREGRLNNLIIGSLNVDGFLNFTVPANTSLLVNNVDGDIQATGLSGSECKLETTYGSVTASNINASLDIISRSGGMKLTDIHGNIHVNLHYGDAAIAGIYGNLQMKSGSGRVSCSGIHGNIDLEASYGNVTLHDLEGNLALTCHSGNVSADHLTGNSCKIQLGYGDLNLGNAKAKLEVVSRSGNITLNEIDGNLLLNSGYGYQHMAHVAGDISSSSGSGNITTSDVKGNLDIRAGYGDVTMKVCKGNIRVNSTSGNIHGRFISVTDSVHLSADYGDIHMNLTNDYSNLGFNVRSGTGRILVSKQNGNDAIETSAYLKKGGIMINSYTRQGNQVFD